MKQKFIVSVPGRAQPLCIEADSFDRDGWNDGGFTFRLGPDVVAQFPAVDMVAKAESMPAFPELSRFRGPDLVLPEPACLASFVEPLPARIGVGISGWGVPAFWPFLSGCVLGLIGGAGLALSHSGLW